VADLVAVNAGVMQATDEIGDIGNERIPIVQLVGLENLIREIDEAMDEMYR